MRRIPVVIVGGGQAGLAVSQRLTGAGVEHVVLERGQVAERWRSRGWASLRMLTPNWMNELPGWPVPNADPDGFLPARAFGDLLGRYAASFGAPVAERVRVRSVTRRDGRYQVLTDAGSWDAGAVVVATGACATPAVPELAAGLDRRVLQLTAEGYRGPADVPAGTVLVVGASATGVQLADELAAAGRDVVLSVGRHTRVPRRYRGRDIMWWLDAMGSFERTSGPREHAPSLQLVGSRWRAVDLPALLDRGVHPVGRLVAADGRAFTFADDLAQTSAAADARLLRLLDRIDRFAAQAGLHGRVGRPERRTGSLARLSPTAPAEFRGRRIRSVVWATGYRRDYPWLHVPVLDGRGEIVHERGRTAAPGLLVAGLGPYARHVPSFVRSAGAEAELVVHHLLAQRDVDRDPASSWGWAS
jgi:putative flavoprotein involved in K+ transport